ncbi:BTB/POZ and MATH domain-containing protein 3-like [Panicum miliaceum]|uniref:BTB/POZ and MATH domain-containing protein 3-like n=1 Tax=Panicum miliaceum TaxID=4540 RepID=A0A3L6TRK0_PANMI|nr:BTB/POZ and MATH domain-containing protein 3-like [Panicum miliaceum]
MSTPGFGVADADDPSSASAIVAGIVTGHHILHIEGYLRIMEEIPNGNRIKSRPFRVGARSWCILYSTPIA